MSSARLRALARRAANRHGIPVGLFFSLISAESGWNPSAGSSAGAIGLTQLMPGTAAGLGVNPRNPAQNLEGGARYLAQQYKTFGSWKLALAAYNAGPGAVSKYGGVPPFKETQAYVQKVLGAAGNLKGGAPAGGPDAATAGSPPPALDGLVDAALQNLAAIGAGQFDATEQLATVAAAAPQEAAGISSQGVGGMDFKGGGGWGGSKNVAGQLIQGLGLSVTSEKRDRKNTSSGGVSDHWSGSKTAYAYDLGGSVGAMDRAAAQLARRLGVKYRKGSPLVATINRGGFRIQVLYRTHTGGNHFDHIHVGVRRL